MRRPAAGLARDQRAARAMSPLPANAARLRSRARDRRIRRGASRDRPRVEVRRTPVAREAARGHDAPDGRRAHRGRRLRGAGAAPSVAPPAPRLQPGARPREPFVRAGLWSLEAIAEDQDANRSASVAAPPQRPRRVRADSGGPKAPRRSGAARGRREHDRRDAGRVRSGPEGRRREGSPRPHSSASRDVTAVITASAIASFDRSPSRTSHRPATACRA